jgi:Ca2+-dependent lipid-binding protein
MSDSSGITVTLIKANELCLPGSTGSSLNPYVVFKVGSRFKKESSVAKGTNNPTWRGEIFWIQVRETNS